MPTLNEIFDLRSVKQHLSKLYRLRSKGCICSSVRYKPIERCSDIDTQHYAKFYKQVRGSALRDEFSCPITRELMRDPVIAADGHTYDREAIEMWLRNHNTSPKVRYMVVCYDT